MSTGEARRRRAKKPRDMPDEFWEKGSGNGQGNGQPVEVKAWPTLREEALYGLPGDVVRFVDPTTEGDPVGLLANLLVAFGNATGRGSYVEVGADRHHLNLNAALVGETATGRKGSTWNPIVRLMHVADQVWAEECWIGGLSSGEGLINAVRDPVLREDDDGDVKVIDEGAKDKRLLVMEGEFAGVLKVMTREGNFLSTVVRQAWDGGKLATLTRHSPLRATDAHISIIGHVTQDELTRRLSETDTQGGFTNRFLWLLVKKSKKLPYGEPLDGIKRDYKPVAERLARALRFAKEAGKIEWGATARPVWETVYDEPSEGEPGMVGAAISRAEAQTLRLAALYAAMDCSRTIEAPHVFAALALWQYAEDSARYIFGTATGDPVTDKIVEALHARMPQGMTRNEIRRLFSGHVRSAQISHAMDWLLEAGAVRVEQEPTEGRPVERWFAL